MFKNEAVVRLHARNIFGIDLGQIVFNIPNMLVYIWLDFKTL